MIVQVVQLVKVVSLSNNYALYIQVNFVVCKFEYPGDFTLGHLPPLSLGTRGQVEEGGGMGAQGCFTRRFLRAQREWAKRPLVLHMYSSPPKHCHSHNVPGCTCQQAATVGTDKTWFPGKMSCTGPFMAAHADSIQLAVKPTLKHAYAAVKAVAPSFATPSASP